VTLDIPMNEFPAFVREDNEISEALFAER